MVGLTTIVWAAAGALLHMGGRPAIAGDAQALAGGGAGDAAHNGDDLPLLGEEAEDRVPVFGARLSRGCSWSCP